MTEQAKKTGWLKKAFSFLVDRIIDPVSRATWWMASAIFLPFDLKREEKDGKKKWRIRFNWKKLAVCALIRTRSWTFPALALLFPRAETVLKEEGIDPVAVQNLAPGKKVHIIKEGLPGTAAGFMVMADIPDWLDLASVMADDNYRAFTTPSLPSWLSDRCVVYFKPGAYGRVRQAYTEKFGHTAQEPVSGLIRNNPNLVPAREEALRVLLHEVAHCSKKNRRMPHGLLKEGDADYQAIRELARQNPEDTGLTERFLHHAAYSFPPATHDDTLYLRARFSGQPIPPLQSLYDAHTEATGLQQKFRAALRFVQEDVPCTPELAHLCDYMPGLKAASPLAKERLNLWLRSYEVLSGDEAMRNQKLPSYP